LHTARPRERERLLTADVNGRSCRTIAAARRPLTASLTDRRDEDTRNITPAVRHGTGSTKQRKVERPQAAIRPLRAGRAFARIPKLTLDCGGIPTFLSGRVAQFAVSIA
jgi:hypothetical protein